MFPGIFKTLEQLFPPLYLVYYLPDLFQICGVRLEIPGCSKEEFVFLNVFKSLHDRHLCDIFSELERINRTTELGHSSFKVLTDGRSSVFFARKEVDPSLASRNDIVRDTKKIIQEFSGRIDCRGYDLVVSIIVAILFHVSQDLI